MMRRRSLGAGLAITAIALFAAFVTAPGAKAATNGWGVVPSANPSEETNILNGVSCVNPTTCWAVGTQRAKGAAHQTLVETLDTTTTPPSWASLSSDNCTDVCSDINSKDKTKLTNALNGVSCDSTTNCWGVGYYVNDSGNWTALGEHWNGTAGHFEASQIGPNGTDETYYKLNGVSCVPVGTTANEFCVAVGISHSDEGFDAFIELWQGSGWENVSPTDQDVELNGVSCVDTSNCFAVGKDGDGQTLTMRTTNGGETWTTQTSPNEGTDTNELNGVSCVSVTFCWAAGYYKDDHIDTSEPSVTKQALVEFWNGTAWSIPTGDIPNISVNQQGELDNILNGIHCESATLCFAVGDVDARSVGFKDQTLIDQFNGTSWSIAVGNPPDGSTNSTTDPEAEPQNNELNGVDCGSLNMCAAVGEFDGGEIVSTSFEAPTMAVSDFPGEDGKRTLVLMWANSTPGTSGTPGTTGGTGTGTGSPSTSVQAAKVPVPATGGGGALPLILLAGAGVVSLGGGITLIRSRKR